MHIRYARADVRVSTSVQLAVTGVIVTTSIPSSSCRIDIIEKNECAYNLPSQSHAIGFMTTISITEFHKRAAIGAKLTSNIGVHIEVL